MNPNPKARLDPLPYEREAAETMVHVKSDPDDPAGRNARYLFTSGARPLEGYTIKRAIGRGGFGEVYYALSDGGKEVALKLITRNLDVERRGVEQCMNLKSPHLITIYDIKSNDEGDTFVIMEYVSGPSLAQILQQHPGGLPLSEIRSWLKGLAQGVAYLHERGIVHRDLKPANLFLEDGVVKIGDYGLSKAISQGREPQHSQSVGTCHYMAPEISKGKYDCSVDIYATGVILYEMITGRVPFDGNSVGEVISRHLFDRPDLSPLPEPFKSIVAKALEKDPRRRPQRVLDLLLPGDAPREPEMRIIGDGKSAPADSRNPAEEVHHIREEDSVLYIGPDTLPPRQPQRAARTRFAQWPWNPARQAPERRRPAQPARATPAGTRPLAPMPVAAPLRPTSGTVPTPIPEPPPLPSTRLRLAELATSMFVACPIAAMAALMALPIGSAINNQSPDRWQLAYLFTFILLGTWGVLIPTKFWEGRVIEPLTRRLILLGFGLALGVVFQFLASWSHLDLVPRETGPATRAISLANWRSGDLDLATTPFVGMASFMGLSFALLGWWKLTPRDRKARFRFGSLFPPMLVGLIVGGILTSSNPWCALGLAGVAAVTQVVSPWDRRAALAARARARASANAA